MSKNERLKVASQGLFFVAGRQRRSTPSRDEIDALTRGEAETHLRTRPRSSRSSSASTSSRSAASAASKTDDYFFMVRIKARPAASLTASSGRRSTRRPSSSLTARCASRRARASSTTTSTAPNLGAAGAPPEPQLPRRGDAQRLRRREPQRDGVAGRRRSTPRARARARGARGGDRRPSSRRARRAYFQVFLTDDDGRNVAPMNCDEPIYGAQYLPRKFKIGIAHPTTTRSTC